MAFQIITDPATMDELHAAGLLVYCGGLTVGIRQVTDVEEMRKWREMGLLYLCTPTEADVLVEPLDHLFQHVASFCYFVVEED